MMTSLTAAHAPQVDDDQLVPEELVGRLYRLGESAVADLLNGLSPTERANLAMFCYRKAHLHRTGLAIAATCDLDTLVQGWGTALGQAVFAQSRARTAEPERMPVGRRAKITLARRPEFVPTAPGIVPDDEMDDVELADEGHQALELAVLADFAAPAEFSIVPSITAAIEPL
jgi:hypothetical protein